MTKQTIFKTVGFFTLSVLAIGILSLFVNTNQVLAHDSIDKNNQMMGRMMNASSSYWNHASLTREEKQEMIGLMKQYE